MLSGVPFRLLDSISANDTCHNVFKHQSSKVLTVPKGDWVTTV